MGTLPWKPQTRKCSESDCRAISWQYEAAGGATIFLLEHKEIRSHFTEVKHIELKSVS